MYKSLIKSAVAGGVIVFIWVMFSWMVIPWHSICVKNFQDEMSVSHAIVQNAPESGIYTIQGMSSQKPMKHFPKPYVFSAVVLGGENMGLGNFTWVLIFQLAAAYIISWMLMQTKGLSYMGRVGFVVLAALVAGILATLPGWNWMGFPLGFTLLCMIDMLIGWFLAGFAMAKLCKK